MQVHINIPIKAQIINGGFVIKVASDGQEWSKSQLGDYADKSGVYIHHTNGRILYIGKTTADSDFGNFGERFRRQFQESASSNSSLIQLLKAQKTPVRSYLMDLSDLDMMIDSGSVKLSDIRKALIMEQVLIGIFTPEGNKI